jgi:hypothetical protein
MGELLALRALTALSGPAPMSPTKRPGILRMSTPPPPQPKGIP